MVCVTAYEERVREVGLRVGYYRRRSGLTQEQLADALDVSWSAISKIETGRCGLSLKMLWGIADVLGVDAADFLMEGGML